MVIVSYVVMLNLAWQFVSQLSLAMISLAVFLVVSRVRVSTGDGGFEALLKPMTQTFLQVGDIVAVRTLRCQRTHQLVIIPYM